MIRQVVIFFLLACACTRVHAQANIITTICGNSTAGFTGDYGPATNAELNTPEYLCLDRLGNVLVSDGFNHRIRKIEVSTGIITTIAGNGTPNYNGDNIAATDAELFVPCAVCVDTAGNVYIADGGNNRVRKITLATGTITTVAGIGPTGISSGGFAGDGGQATDAQLNGPGGLCVDKFGNIYIGDYFNNKVRRVDAATGIITTFAGVEYPSYAGGFVGYSGDGGPATAAVISGPIQVFADSVGNVYICDQWNNAIRKVDIANGIISTIAGTGTAGYSGDGGLAMHAHLNQPCGMYIDMQNNLFIVDGGGALVRRIDGETGIINTVAGTDTLGFSGDNGPATDAKINAGDVAVDNYSVIYIADEDNNRIRKVYNPKLVVPETFAKNGVKIFPNPAQEEITIEYGFSEDGAIQITDIAGRVVAVKKLSSQKQSEEIEVSSLASGLYVYRVLQNNILVSAGKVIKD